MRSSLRRSAVLCFPFFGVVALACNPSDDGGTPEDDGGTIDTGASFDGGITTPPDGGGLTDGGSGTDGAVVSPGSIEVTVQYADNLPEPNADVYFFEDTQPVFHATTDSFGKASHDVGHVTSVTVLRHTTEYVGYREIVTVLAAQPGDRILVGNEGSPPVASVANVEADIPGTAAYTGATAYGEDMGDCISGSTTQTGLPVTAFFAASSCYKVGDSVDVLVSAAGTGGAILAYASKSALLATAGTTVTFATGDWKATTTKGASFTGTPPTWASYVGASVRFASSVGANYALQAGSASIPTDLSTLTVSYSVPPLTSSVLRSTFTASGSLGLAQTASTIYRHGAPSDALGFDYAKMLPRITAPSVSSATVNAPVVGWTPDSPIASGSLGIAHLTAPPGDAGGTLDWRIVFPTNGASITPPALPAEVSAFQPGGAWKIADVSLSTGAIKYEQLRQSPTKTPQTLIWDVGATAGDVQTTTVSQ